MAGKRLLTGHFSCLCNFFIENMKKVGKKFGGFKKSPYLCTRLQEITT